MHLPDRQVEVADNVFGTAAGAFVAAFEVGNATAASASYTLGARLVALHRGPAIRPR